MPSKPSSPRPVPAKERILLASRLLFARKPVSQASLRDIAAAAQADVAYVHRAFGSKAEIFRQALDSLAPDKEVFALPMEPDQLIDRLCDHALQRDPQRVEDVEPLHLIMQSFACGEARGILADFIEAALARPLAEAFGQKDIGRAMFAISIMGGFVTSRVVIGHPALRDMPEAELKAMLAKAMRGAMTD